MHLFKELHLKDKVAFEKIGRNMRKIGSPVSLAKSLKKQGFAGLQIVDLDLKKNSEKNFDVYDSLTQILFVQVDIEKNIGEASLSKLYAMNARAVFYPGFDPKSVEKKFSAFAMKNCNDDNEAKFFTDVIIEKAKDLERAKAKRIFLKGKFSEGEIKKAKPFAVIK